MFGRPRCMIAFIDGDWLADGVIWVAWQADPCLQPKNRLSTANPGIRPPPVNTLPVMLWPLESEGLRG